MVKNKELDNGNFVIFIIYRTVSFTLIFSFAGANEKIETISSTVNNYTFDFYRFDAGAAGSFGVRGELNGPLWF